MFNFFNLNGSLLKKLIYFRYSVLDLACCMLATVSGAAPLTFRNAIADKRIVSLKQFGATKHQDGSLVPQPYRRVPMICNNGGLYAANGSILPIAYERFESTDISVDGYIQTIVLDSSTIITLDFAAEGDGTICGDYGEVQTAFFSSGDVFYVIDGNGDPVNTGVVNDHLRHTVVLDYHNSFVKIDDTVVHFAPFPSGFRDHTATRLFPDSAGRVYRFTAVQNGTIVLSCVPCGQRRSVSERVAGLYNTVHQTRYFIQATGDASNSGHIPAPLFLITSSTYELMHINNDNNNSADVTTILNGVGNVRDEYDIATGTIIRRCKGMVLTGEPEENWVVRNFNGATTFCLTNTAGEAVPNMPLISDYFQTFPGINETTAYGYGLGCFTSSTGEVCFRYSSLSTLDDWLNYLINRKCAGYPVCVMVPLLEETVEHEYPQTFSTISGTNTITITTEYDGDIEVEVTYAVEGDVTTPIVNIGQADFMILAS